MVMARVLVPFWPFCKPSSIDAVRLVGHFPTVSTDTNLDPNKKHRHDVGAVDHGPTRTSQTTRTIQIIMGTSILLTGGLIAYAALAGWLEIAAP